MGDGRHCNASFIKSGGQCVSCGLQAGKYSPGGTESCWDCTKRPANSVYILPSGAADGFKATSDACPW